MIRNLKLFLSFIPVGRVKWVRVVPRRMYERRIWSVGVECGVRRRGGDQYCVLCEIGDSVWEVCGSRDKVVEAMYRRYPPDSYVYVKARPYYAPNYYSLGVVLFSTVYDEAEAMSLLLARSMGKLNGRRLYGVQIVDNTSKKCIRCKRSKGRYKLVFRYGDVFFSEHYCRECLIEVVREAFSELRKSIDNWEKEFIEWVMNH